MPFSIIIAEIFFCFFKFIILKILCAIFPHLIKHYNAAGIVEKTYFFMIEYAACLLAQNKSFEVKKNLRSL